MSQIEMTLDEKDLEIALRLAAVDPASRPDFYRLLLGAKIYILGTPIAHSPLRQGNKAGTDIGIKHWVESDGSAFIPFFSSLGALQSLVKGNEPYVQLPAKVLFSITKGETLFLNPGGSYGKEFRSGDVEALLSSDLAQLSGTVIIPLAKLTLDTPRDPPSRLLSALSSLFATRREVQAAYAGAAVSSVPTMRDRLVVGIFAEGDISAVIRDAGLLVRETRLGGVVDFIPIGEKDSELRDRFQDTLEPFYERHKRSS